MEFLLLGPLEAVRDGRPVALGGAKQRALVALLLLHANEVVSRDRVIDELWPDRPPGAAGHNLDVQVSRLRKGFDPEELLLTRAGGYVLRIAPEQVDVHRFERLLEEGRAANASRKPREALQALRAALGLWRGGALADLAYESFARPEIDRLEDLRLVAIEERIEAELALGQHDTLVPELEALTAEHPLRERLRGQQMLALYRAGRQAEALRVYSETRKRLVEELGIEPGQALKEREQAILRQDPALDPAPVVASVRRRRGALMGALALVVAGGAAAAIVLVTQGGAHSARALAQPESNVFLAAGSGKVVRQVAVPGTAHVRFGLGSLWSVSVDGELTRVDPETGKTVARIGLGITPSGLAAGAGSVWVTDLNSRTLLRVDPALNVVADRIPLPKAGNEQTQDVLVADGSVWIAHGGENPGAWVERLDPATGRVRHRFSILGGEASALAFADGALWVASAPAGDLRKIDPGTNSIVHRVHLKEGICCLAAGAGYVWAAVNPDATIWKLGEDGSIVSTIKLPARIESLSYGNGSLWVADGEAGTVVRIDPTTDARRTYRLGHHLTGVAVQKGLVVVGVRQSAADATAGLKGRIVRVARKDDSLFWSGAPTDPALWSSWDAPQLEFHYATCAKLLNYPDVEGEAGRKLVPEVATAWPAVTDGGRTYTFTIRNGYRFSPPSNEPVTAESFRHTIERVVSPKLPWFEPTASDIVGAAAYHAGKAPHVAGLSVRGDTLTIRLVKPAPDFPRRIALSLYCVVPDSTPVVSHGVDAPIPSAGPYYLAAHTDSAAVLKRNPNYHGPRPQHVDAIVYRFGVAPGDGAARIAKDGFDYMLESDPALAPDTAAARTAGRRYRLTPVGFGGTDLLALNTSRPLFADARRRRAVQYALDRRVLGEIEQAIPATRLLPPKLPGFDAASLYPLRPDLRRARALTGGRRFHAVFATFDPKADPQAAAFAQAVRGQLAAIGIDTTVLPLTNADYQNGTVDAKVAGADIAWSGAGSDDGDPVPFLERLKYLPVKDRLELGRIARLAAPAREARAAALAVRIEKESLDAVYGYSAIPELVSPRLGCVVHQPEYAGVDLAALCVNGSTR
jgi:DNA-binding SARP family transcriptional activator/ABC-type transport system substrate-binding protein